MVDRLTSMTPSDLVEALTLHGLAVSRIEQRAIRLRSLRSSDTISCRTSALGNCRPSSRAPFVLSGRVRRVFAAQRICVGEGSACRSTRPSRPLGGSGDRTDQEWRSTGHRAAHSVAAMDVSIHIRA
jgi:hypothetical protein